MRRSGPAPAPAIAPVPARSPSAVAELADSARTLLRLAEALDWRSYDPYDLLLARPLRGLPRRSPLLARVAVQAGRRLGAAPRRLLGIAPHEEAKVLADFLSASVMLAEAGASWAEAYVPPLVERLLARSFPTPSGRGWGIEFPYASRFVSVPARTPNIYSVTNAVHALLDAYRITRDRRSLSAAMEGIQFIVRDLGYHERGGRVWLRYWPGSDDRIVNVQALGAGVLARAAAAWGDGSCAALAGRAAATVVAVQRRDGSWRYSEDGRADFVDGFHTGFTLQGLTEYLANRPAADATHVREALEAGLAFFRRRLVTPGGLPLDFAGGRTTTDGQTAAQCVQTLAVCGQGRPDRALALRVWHATRIGRRRRPRAAFWLAGDYPKLRWEIGPAALATAHLVRALQQGDAAAGEATDGPGTGGR